MTHELLEKWLDPVVVVPMLLIAGTFAIIGFAILGWDKGQFVLRLREKNMARGLITYLFTVTTIGVAITLVFAGLTNNDEASGHNFERGKDILALLLGVFGTMVGYYFGSDVGNKVTNSFSVTPLRLPENGVSYGSELPVTAYVSGGTAPYEYRILIGKESLKEDLLTLAEGWIDTSIKLPDAKSPSRVRVTLEITDQSGERISAMAMLDLSDRA